MRLVFGGGFFGDVGVVGEGGIFGGGDGAGDVDGIWGAGLACEDGSIGIEQGSGGVMDLLVDPQVNRVVREAENGQIDLPFLGIPMNDGV